MPNTLFSTYSEGENRVTSTILAVLERLSFALVEQLLQALLQEPEAQLVTFRNQVKGEASVPDARIRASFSYWIETKIVPRAVSERQIRAHLLALDAEPRVDRQRLLVLTPDDAVPDVVSRIGDSRLGWASFADLAAAVEQALELDEGWIASEQAIPSERERELLRELVHFLLSEGLVRGQGREVLVVPARVALPEYLELSLYMCQPNRTFRAVSHLAFYAGGRIDPHVPAVLGSVESVLIGEEGVRAAEGLDEALRAQLLAVVRRLEAESSPRLGLEQKVLFLSAPDAPETVHLPRPVENDLLSESGRPAAFVQGQRYVPLSALQAGPKTTSELLALAGERAG